MSMAGESDETSIVAKYTIPQIIIILDACEFLAFLFYTFGHLKSLF
jgi:hypothetical protein